MTLNAYDLKCVASFSVSLDGHLEKLLLGNMVDFYKEVIMEVDIVNTLKAAAFFKIV